MSPIPKFEPPDVEEQDNLSPEEENKSYQAGIDRAKKQGWGREDVTDRMTQGGVVVRGKSEPPPSEDKPKGKEPPAEAKPTGDEPPAEGKPKDSEPKDPPGTSTTDTPGKEGESTGSAPKKDPEPKDKELSLEERYKQLEQQNSDLSEGKKGLEDALKREQGRIRNLRRQAKAAPGKPASTSDREPPQSRKAIDTALGRYEEVDPEYGKHLREAFKGVFQELDDLKDFKDKALAGEAEQTIDDRSDALEESLPGWQKLVVTVDNKKQAVYTPEFQEFYDSLPHYKQAALDDDSTPVEDWIEIITPWYQEKNPDSSNKPSSKKSERTSSRRSAQRKSASGPSSRAAPVDPGALGEGADQDTLEAGYEMAKKKHPNLFSNKPLPRLHYGGDIKQES